MALWAFLIPVLFAWRIYANRGKDKRIRKIMKFGFIINEYKENLNFWEIIKVMEKISIILAQLFLVNSTKEKGIFIFLILFIYGISTIRYMPFYSR